MTRRASLCLQEPHACAHHSTHNHYRKRFLTDRHTTIHDRRFLQPLGPSLCFPQEETTELEQHIQRDKLYMKGITAYDPSANQSLYFLQCFINCEASPASRCYFLSCLTHSQPDNCIRILPPTNDS